MNPKVSSVMRPASGLDYQAFEITIAQLVGQAFEAAPATERGHLLEHLLKPLGVLSLVVVANGVFAKIRFRGGWPGLSVRPEDALNVQASDVVSLVDFVQQISVEAVDGLAQVLSASPVMAGSAAAALLVTILVQRAGHSRRSEAAAAGAHPQGEL